MPLSGPPYPTCGECLRWKVANSCVLPEVVPFSGNGTVYVIVGQDPGFEEDHQGRPWVGRSGSFTRRLVERLRLMGASQVVLTNALRCMPEAVRPPTKVELACCLPNLKNDLSYAESLGPVVIVACGRVAEAALRQLGRTDYCYVAHPSSFLRTGQPAVRWVSQAVLAIKSKTSNESDVVVLDHTHVDELTGDVLAVDAEFNTIDAPYLISVSDGKRSVYFTPDVFYKLSFLKDKTLVAHNAVVECAILKILGIEARSWVDTLSWVRAFDDRIRADLRTVSAYMFDVSYQRPKELRKGLVTDEVVKYNCIDSSMSFRTYQRLRLLVEDTPLHKHLLTRLVPFLVDMGLRGIRIDRKAVAELRNSTQKEMHEIVQQLKSYADINWNSLKQVGEYFASKGITVPSLDKVALSSLGLPEAELLLKYRSKQKLMSTYLQYLDVDRVTFLLSPSGTETGRLSFLDGRVNIHTIPEELRKVFIPDPGYVWVKADYKTHEVVVLAWLAESPILRKDVVDWNREPKPITELLNKGDPYDQLSPIYAHLVSDKSKLRDLTKMTFLALMYGAGASKIYHQALRMGVVAEKEDVEEVVRTLRKRLSSIEALREYLGRERTPLRTGGFISTFSWPPLWRRRTFEVRTMDDREEWRKALVNSPTQGAAADICTLAAVTLASRGYQVLNIVHDEIDLQVPENAVDEALSEIREVMLVGWCEGLDLLCIPDLRVELSVREHW